MAHQKFWNNLLTLGRKVAQEYLRQRNQPRPHREQQIPRPKPDVLDVPTPGNPDLPAYPGDYTGVPKISYDPVDDNHADPGEVVWTWVPFEEDYTQGKDRPVLVIGRDGPWLLALQVSTKDSASKHQYEESVGRHWVDIGSGEWDHDHRPSEARANRILRIDPTAVRRIGAKLNETVFNRVAAEVRKYA